MKFLSNTLLLLLSDGLSFSQTYVSSKDLQLFFPKQALGSLRVALHRLKKNAQVEGIIKNGVSHVRLTAQGIKKIKERFLLTASPGLWDGIWRVLIVDRAEKNMSVRLRKLGFGMLRSSTYISPFAIPIPLEKQSFFLLETSRIDNLEPREIAQLAWNLSSLESRYYTWIDTAEKMKGQPAVVSLIFDYMLLVRDDPRLPKQLLPPDWPAKKAIVILRKIIRKHLALKKAKRYKKFGLLLG